MSLEIALQNAISGLQVSKQALQTISNNIANVNTEGYTRKIVEQTARVIEGQGYGVEISRLKRSVDSGVLRQLRTETGGVQMLSVKQDFLKQVNSLFGKPEDNDAIVHQIAELGSQFDSLAVSPETESNQYLTVKAADNLVLKFANMSDSVQKLRSDANSQISSQVDEFNEKMDLVVSLNTQIIQFTASKVSTAELEDQRDQALNRMSEIMDIKYFEKGDGSMTVFTAGGQTLIDGQAQHLTYNQPAGLTPILSYTPTDAVNYVIPGQPGYPVGGIPGIFVGEQIASQDITSTIKSGSLKGLLDMRDNELPSLQSQMDELAEKLRDGINTAHNAGAGYPPVVGLTGDRFVNSNMSLQGTGLVRIAALNEDGTLSSSGNAHTFDLSSYATVGDLVTDINTQMGGNITASINSSGRLEIAANNNQRVAINELTSNISAAGDLNKGFSDFFGLNNFYQSAQNFSSYRSDLVSTATSGAVTTGGTLQFTTSSGATTSINYASNASLNTLVSSINGDATLSGAGISAQVVADGDGYRLQIIDAQGDQFGIVETGGGSLQSDINPRPDYRGISAQLSVRSDIEANSFYVSRGALQSNTFNSAVTASSPTTAVGAGTAGTLTFTMADGTTTTVSYDGDPLGGNDSLQDIADAINSNTTLAANSITAQVIVSGSNYTLRINDAQSDNFWIDDSAAASSTSLGVENTQGVSVGDGTVAADIASAFSASNTFLAAPASGGGLARTNASFSDYAASILSFNSSQADAVERDNTYRQNLTNELYSKNAAISSVNMDEELSNLIVYEQAYLAASRMITTTQELYKALTDMVG